MALLRTAAAAVSSSRRREVDHPAPNRRKVLKGALGLGAATAMGLRPAAGQTATARIAVVGAGLAGLTAAYRLKQAGFNPVVFEGNTRLGGRCFTARGVFQNGQIAEHGGEFIDTDHYEIRGLAKELGLTLYDVLAAQPPRTIPVYRFNGERYTLADATADFGQLYLDLKGQSAAIGGSYSYQYSTAGAKRYDAMTARQWIVTYVPGGLSSKLGQLIDNAFAEENAADTDHQSALNIITTLADDPRDNFDLYYTDSDQRFRVLGGNDQIPTLLGAALPGAIETGSALVGIRKRDDGRIVLTFARGSGYRDVLFDRVVLALPFAVMRAAVDYSNAGFQPLKVQSIAQLGMGASVKFQLQFERRLWNDLGCNGEIRLPSPAFETTWDATRGQAGTTGVFNFWSGGSQALFDGASPDRNALATLCLAGANEILPGLPPLWNGLSTLDIWRRNPWSLGSYSFYPPGYQTTLFGIEKQPEGNVFFAGEHTWSQAGFLNAGVASGERAARQVAASLAA